MILWKHCPGSLRELPIPTPHLCLHTCILLQFHIYRDLHQILKTAIENTQMQQLWITYAYPPPTHRYKCQRPHKRQLLLFEGWTSEALKTPTCSLQHRTPKVEVEKWVFLRAFSVGSKRKLSVLLIHFVYIFPRKELLWRATLLFITVSSGTLKGGGGAESHGPFLCGWPREEEVILIALNIVGVSGWTLFKNRCVCVWGGWSKFTPLPHALDGRPS